MKYRKKVISEEVSQTLKQTCMEISKRHEIHFVEIGVDEDYVHFLVQSVPMLAPKVIVQRIKSITAIEIFKNHKEVKKMLWGGKFWTSGYYMNIVGKHGNEEVIRQYVKNQGKNYEQVYRGQLELFEGVV